MKAVYPWKSCPSAHLSVRLSFKRVDCDKTKESSAKIFLPYERTFIPVLRRMVGGGRPLVPDILGQTDPVRAKTTISIDIRS